MLVTIMQGIPGSGKSTLARKMLTSGGENYIVSADHEFETADGYQFDPSKLGLAHARCLKRFVGIVSISCAYHVIVDNTNTRIEEIAPYYALAEAYGHDVRILRVDCEPAIAFKRCQHGVPEKNIWEMSERIRQFPCIRPARWKIEHADQIIA